MKHLYFICTDNIKTTRKLNIFEVLEALNNGYTLTLIK